MEPEELLVLNYDQFSERVGKLFQSLSQSPAARDVFVKDPTGVVSQFLFVGLHKRQPAVISRSNRLFYALMSNKGFREWGKKYSTDLKKELARHKVSSKPGEALKSTLAALDRGKIYNDIARGALEFVDQETLYSLFSGFNLPEIVVTNLPSGPIVSSVSDDDNVAVFVEVAVAVVVVAVAVAFAFAGDPDYLGELLGEISAEDLMNVVSQLVSALEVQAAAVRESGQLTALGSFD